MTSIPEIGEDGFLPKVLAYIRAQLGVEGSTDQSDTDDDDIATEPPQINASIFSSILLDRIVEGAGVILDVDVHGLTAHRSAQAIRGVSQHVETMMSGIFGLETRYLHLAARATPEELVASLISAKPGASSSTAAEIPQVLVLSGLERCRSGVWAKLVDISIKRYIEMEEWRVEQDHSTDTEPDTSRIPLPAGFTIIWVREESLADTIPSYLIDRFSLNEPIHPSDVVPLPILPVRALFPPLLLTNLTTLLPYMHIHPPLQIHISNLLSGITAHPRLHSSITGRAATLFPRLVQAHRLLSGPFYLPMGWQEGLERRRRIQAGEDVDAYTFYNGKDGRGGGDGGKGLSGGKGGVGMWDVFSGSEPSVLDLGRAVTGEVEEEEEEEDEPYTTPVNVEGVFWTGLRHRVRYREERDEVMWLLKGSASDMLAGKGEASTKDGRRKGREVDRVLGRILQSV